MQKGDAMDAAERSERIPDIVIITGMSGSGRTQAMHVFEDMGYFCIDNLPPRLIAQLAELVGINTGVGRHLAVTCDLRSQGLFDELLDAVAALEEREMSCDIVFLEASDEVLIRRYSENRRRHPIAKPGETTADAIQRERLQLQGVRDRADMIIDTSRLRTSALRNKLRMAFSELSDQQLMDVHVFSFGFKHGMPVEADIMIDVRFLPNPFYDPEMRTMTGLDKKVSDFVLDHPKTQEFWKAWTQLLDTVMPGYIVEGKPQLSIAIGCTGGQHRSVAIAEAAEQRRDRHGHHAVQAAAVARCAGAGPDVHEQRRRGQQADPPEAQQAVELVIKLRAHHGQQHDREQDAQQVVTKQQQENQRGHDQNTAHDRQPGRHEHREHQKADRKVQLAVPEAVRRALAGGNERRRAADALIEERTHAVKHPRKTTAAPRLLHIRLDAFIKSIHKHQNIVRKAPPGRPGAGRKNCVTGRYQPKSSHLSIADAL